MSDINQTKNDLIIASLLEADDFDDESLVKELSGPTDDFLDQQLCTLLPYAIKAKETYLNKKCVKTSQLTNPKGETYVFGRFGSRNGVMSTLLYLSPTQGWKLTEDVEDDDFKEIYGDPRPKWLPLGSISWGTMREKDLIPRFLSVLRSIDPARAAELQAEYEQLPEEEHPDFCWETVFNALEAYAPPYTQFGSHEGDGSDYGVWISNDSIDEELENDNPEELRAIKQGDPFIPGTGYIVVVDNAGNYTALLDGSTGREIWSV